MPIVLLRSADLPYHPPAACSLTAVVVPEEPSRTDLRILSDAAQSVLPHDPTPSLADIAASPSVAHLGVPHSAPQVQAGAVTEPLRVVVSGSDRLMHCVLSYMMRRDILWADVAYIPSDPTSVVARAWGLHDLSPVEREEWAYAGSSRPAPTIRDDAGHVVCGVATVTEWNGAPMVGEIIVDDAVLGRGEGRSSFYGARLIALPDAPGIAAVRLVSLRQGMPWRRRHVRIDDTSLLAGRALQAGGINLRVVVDGRSRKRPSDRVTFYRHLRDMQVVRR